MELHALIPLIVAFAIALAVVGAARRIALWRRGRPTAVPLFGGLLAAPKRYFVDLHHVVARDRPSAQFHVLAAGGFVAALILILVVHPAGLGGTVLAWVLTAALAVMTFGIALAVKRRFVDRPARLSPKRAWRLLPVGLAAFAVGFALVTPPLAGLAPAWLAVATVVLGLAVMVVGMAWGGPMKHAFAGTLHLAYHPRPERFGQDRPSADLRPVDLDAPQLGVARISDLPWNRVLGFDACVECGRCEVMCPAFAAGQPLSPRAFIQDMLGAARSDASAEILASGLVAPETIWSCTTCRACVHECPMMIEHVDSMIDLRRYATMEKGATPGKGAEVLEDLRATDNPGGRDPGARADWATDLKLPLMAEKKETDLLFWVGDAAYDLRSQRTLRAVAKLLRAAKADFAILGAEEADCGDLARRLGDDATFRALAERNVATLARYRFKRIVTADPHALHVLANEYPAFGGVYTVLHHTQLLDALITDGTLAVAPALGGGNSKVTYHDPCYLGRYNGETEAPRRLLSALGIKVTEMERSGLRSRCCGGGGGAPVTDIPGERRIPDMRMEDVRATDAETVAVACPQCCAMLEGVVQPRAEVRDVAELLLEGLRT